MAARSYGKWALIAAVVFGAAVSRTFSQTPASEDKPPHVPATTTAPADEADLFDSSKLKLPSLKLRSETAVLHIDEEEILRLRDAVGDAGVGSSDAFRPYETGGAPAESELETPSGRRAFFRSTIRRLAEADAQSPENTLPEVEFGPAFPPEHESRRTEAAEPNDQASALREAAAQLDAAAHLLERQELYSQADDLRAQATRLRENARTLSARGPEATATRLKRPTMRAPLRR